MDNNNTFYDQEPNTNDEPRYQQQTTYQEQPYQQQPYQQNLYQQAGNSNFAGQPYMEEPMSLSDWMLTMLVMCIPCVNIIMMFVWAFSSSEKKSKSNYFKAVLIWGAIAIGISILLSVVVGISAASIASGF